MFEISSLEIKSKHGDVWRKNKGIKPADIDLQNSYHRMKPLRVFCLAGFLNQFYSCFSFIFGEKKSNSYLLFRINQILALTTTVNERGRSSWGIYPLINPPINCYGIIDNRNTNVRCENKRRQNSICLKELYCLN